MTEGSSAPFGRKPPQNVGARAREPHRPCPPAPPSLPDRRLPKITEVARRSSSMHLKSDTLRRKNATTKRGQRTDSHAEGSRWPDRRPPFGTALPHVASTAHLRRIAPRREATMCSHGLLVTITATSEGLGGGGGYLFPARPEPERERNTPSGIGAGLGKSRSAPSTTLVVLSDRPPSQRGNLFTVSQC